MANSVDPDQTAPLGAVCTVCPGLSVRKLRIITVEICSTLPQICLFVNIIFLSIFNHNNGGHFVLFVLINEKDNALHKAVKC